LSNVLKLIKLIRQYILGTGPASVISNLNSMSLGLLLKHNATTYLFVLFFNTNLSQISEHMMIQGQFKNFITTYLTKHLRHYLHHGPLF